MGRTPKNNCDYFPHDRDMRNHRKIKAIRSKFGIQGYGIWVMILEYITGNDGNVFQYTDLEFELMSGDFGVSGAEIRDVVNYCISLDLLFNENGFIRSESLDERLAPVYAKRGKLKELSKQQSRKNGSFCSRNTAESVVSEAEMPQSIVEYSKVYKNIYTSVGEKKNIHISVKAKYLNEKPVVIYDLQEYFTQQNQITPLNEKGWTHFDQFMHEHPGKVFNDYDHLYNTFKKFCIEFKPPLPKVSPYSDAEYNKTLWTTAAWEERYQHKIDSDINFRKHFGYE